MMRLTRFLLVIISVLALSAQIALAQEEDTMQLAEAAQNPISDMISVPFQNNFDFDYGAEDEMRYILNVQPVIPFKLNEDWNVITRTIVPIIYLPELTEGSGTKFGLGDINPTIFLSPSKPSKWLWGLGPTFTFPSATDKKLGSKKWSAGPSGVLLSINGPWVYGALVSNQWSYAGDDDRKDVNAMLMQPFINYNMADGWYVSTSPIITANWEADDNDDQWTVPLGGGLGKVFSFGKQPINASLQSYYNVVKPEIGPDWSVRFQIQLLFPAKRK